LAKIIPNYLQGLRNKNLSYNVQFTGIFLNNAEIRKTLVSVLVLKPLGCFFSADSSDKDEGIPKIS
jgi:hypothetical protein